MNEQDFWPYSRLSNIQEEHKTVWNFTLKTTGKSHFDLETVDEEPLREYATANFFFYFIFNSMPLATRNKEGQIVPATRQGLHCLWSTNAFWLRDDTTEKKSPLPSTLL